MDLAEYREACLLVSCPACGATGGVPCRKLNADGTVPENPELVAYVHDDRSLLHFATVWTFFVPPADASGAPLGKCNEVLYYVCSKDTGHEGNHKPGQQIYRP